MVETMAGIATIPGPDLSAREQVDPEMSKSTGRVMRRSTALKRHPNLFLAGPEVGLSLLLNLLR